MTALATMDPQLTKLIEDHIHLASIIATQVWRTAQHALEQDELVGLANEGLVKAANRWPEYCERNGFDPGRIEYFTPYATRTMKGAIFDALRASDWATRSQRTRAKLLQQAGQDQGLSEAELSARTGLSIEEIRSTTAGLARRPVSIDAEAIDYEAPHDVEGTAGELAILDVMVRTVSDLPEAQQAVLALHYYEGMELQAVAQRMGITESRASHLHTDAVLQVRAVLRAHLDVA
jgi:RNA polymerase sigma factor for flagellar operon FliA